MKNNLSISLYWKCQLIGWSVTSLYWSYIGFSGGQFNVLVGLLQFLSDILIYITITHLYRIFALKHKWQQLNLNQLLKRIIPAVLVMGVVYLLVTMLKSYAFRFWLSAGNVPSFLTFFKLNWVTMLMAGIRLMAIWLLAYHLCYYAQREINIAKENARLAVVVKDAQLSSLSAQLNPHFLFNSLNNIKALIIENPKSARRAIDLLSDLLRTALYDGEELLTTIKDELALVKDYFELEKLRFEERLQFCIDIDDSLNNILILRFCIQTLAENAVKHGIGKQKNGGVINVRVAVVNHYIIISLQNPGEFNSNAPTGGLGLKNLNERLLLQYKGRAKFHIKNEPGGNVLSTIVIPYS